MLFGPKLGKTLRCRFVLTGLCQCFHVVSNKVLNTFQGICIKDRNTIIVTILLLDSWQKTSVPWPEAQIPRITCLIRSLRQSIPWWFFLGNWPQLRKPWSELNTGWTEKEKQAPLHKIKLAHSQKFTFQHGSNPKHSAKTSGFGTRLWLTLSGPAKAWKLEWKICRETWGSQFTDSPHPVWPSLRGSSRNGRWNRPKQKCAELATQQDFFFFFLKTNQGQLRSHVQTFRKKHAN